MALGREVRDPVRRMAREIGWGAPRISDRPSYTHLIGGHSNATAQRSSARSRRAPVLAA